MHVLLNLLECNGLLLLRLDPLSAEARLVDNLEFKLGEAGGATLDAEESIGLVVVDVAASNTLLGALSTLVAHPMSALHLPPAAGTEQRLILGLFLDNGVLAVDDTERYGDLLGQGREDRVDALNLADALDPDGLLLGLFPLLLRVLPLLVHNLAGV